MKEQVAEIERYIIEHQRRDGALMLTHAETMQLLVKIAELGKVREYVPERYERGRACACGCHIMDHFAQRLRGTTSVVTRLCCGCA